MRRIKLVVAYDGTNYCGWQLQPNGITVEEVLNQALSDLVGESVSVIGASRTDSGVHSKGNVAVFDTESRIPAEKICFAVNQRLPEDVRVQSSQEVPLTWHPRKQNCVKTYEYRIWNRKIDMPVGRLYAHFCYYDLDVERMKAAAEYLVGEHDFKSFCTARSPEEDTVRTIYSLTVDRDADGLITIRVSGSGFLYNMVRIIAGTLLEVGMGMYPPERMEEILAARDRQAAGGTAPAKGLTMVGMEYETELRPIIEMENSDWKYLLVQKEIPVKGKAYLNIRRCREEDFSRLVARLVHQCHRNGAKEIFVMDAEPGKDRLAEGQKYGYYRLRRAHRYVVMEKQVDREACGREAQGSLLPLRRDGRKAWLSLYQEAFFDVPGSATYSEEMIEEEQGEGVKFFWFRYREARMGFAVIKEDKEGSSMELDMLGIRKDSWGEGLGGLLMEALEARAVRRGLSRMELMVADTNERAVNLYRRMGFAVKEERPWYFLAEDAGRA